MDNEKKEEQVMLVENNVVLVVAKQPVMQAYRWLGTKKSTEGLLAWAKEKGYASIVDNSQDPQRPYVQLLESAQRRTDRIYRDYWVVEVTPGLLVTRSLRQMAMYYENA